MYRKSKFEDLTSVYNLVCELEGRSLPFDHFSDIYEKQMNDRHYYCLICEHEDKIIGMLNLRFEEQLHHAERIAEILEFVIDPAYRSRGIGKELFSTACRLAKKEGCIQIEAACNQLREDTHRFYIREGMQKFHYKFSKSLTETDPSENTIGR